MYFKRKAKPYKRKFKRYRRYKKKKGVRSLLPKPVGRNEKKFIDASLSLSTFNTTGSSQLLNALSQGTTATTRVGNEAIFKSIYMKATVYPGVTTGVTQNIRVMLVLDKQPNGAAMPIVGATSTTGRLLFATAGTCYPYVPLDLFNKDRYVSLYDKVYAINPPFSTAAVQFEVKKYINLGKGIQSIYNGNAGTIADLSSNALYLVICGDQPSGNNAMNIAGNIRLRYVDN